MKKICATLMLILAGCEGAGMVIEPTGCDPVLGCGTAAGNDFSNPFNPIIGGVPVYCTSFDGQPVATYNDPALNDVGRALQTSPPSIVLNGAYLAMLPPALQLFWYGHECAHHHLGHTVFTTFQSESQADCWSIQIAKAQGLYTRADVQAFAPYFVDNPGSPWGHLPGPQRLELFLQCWDAAP